MAALTLWAGLLCVQQADEIHFSIQVGKIKIRSLAQNSLIIMKIKSHRGPELDTAGQSTQSEVRGQPSPHCRQAFLYTLWLLQTFTFL